MCIRDSLNTLKAMQELVGGHIEIVDYQGACLVCNEEGKLLGLEPNRRVGQDVILSLIHISNLHSMTWLPPRAPDSTRMPPDVYKRQASSSLPKPSILRTAENSRL